MKSLDSIDKSLDDRFDRKRQTINESQIRDYDLHKKHKNTSTFFRLEFSPSIPKETKLFLISKTHAILDYPSKFGLYIIHAMHLIRFIDQKTYELEMGKPLPKYIHLPASRFEIINAQKEYKITIIIPKNINKAEIIINITRNIFSKIYGRIFFNEQIIPLEFYQESLQGHKKYSATVLEILDLIDGINFPSNILKSHYESFARSIQLNLSKNNKIIKEKLIETWRKKCKNKTLSQKEKYTIESIFSEFIKEFENNPIYYFKSISQQIKKLNSEMHFILPHEINAYNNFEEKRFIHYLRVVKNKLEEINSLSGFIEEIDSLLKTNSTIDDLKKLAMLIRKRMGEMVKEKKVLHFYLPEINNNLDFKNLKERFPLLLIKMLPRGTPIKEWSKEVKKLEINYANSIYSKIYSYLHSYSKWVLMQKEFNAENFLVSEEGENLKKLLSILKFKTNSTKFLISNLGLLIDTSENLSLDILKESPKNLIPLDDFGKAWSYFISSVLTLLYYKDNCEFESLPKGFRSENFLKSIMDFIEKQCAQGINYFHIVKLLWLIYEKCKNNALEFLIYCIKNPQINLRYTLNQLMIPETGDGNLDSRLEKLFQYRDSMISVHQKRLNESKNEFSI